MNPYFQVEQLEAEVQDLKSKRWFLIGVLEKLKHILGHSSVPNHAIIEKECQKVLDQILQKEKQTDSTVVKGCDTCKWANGHYCEHPSGNDCGWVEEFRGVGKANWSSWEPK